MSVGVNLCFKLLELAARALGDGVDIEIVEAHHRHKVDAPSGTALAMGQVVATALGRDLRNARFTGGKASPASATAPPSASPPSGPAISSANTPCFLPMWASVIEITHRASSRMTFAKGALRAAAWLAGRDPGSV
jgi:4-hydroxy-tetrahydrodipicolinate reductase